MTLRKPLHKRTIDMQNHLLFLICIVTHSLSMEITFEVQSRLQNFYLLLKDIIKYAWVLYSESSWYEFIFSLFVRMGFYLPIAILLVTYFEGALQH